MGSFFYQLPLENEQIIYNHTVLCSTWIVIQQILRSREVNVNDSSQVVRRYDGMIWCLHPLILEYAPDRIVPQVQTKSLDKIFVTMFSLVSLLKVKVHDHCYCNVLRYELDLKYFPSSSQRETYRSGKSSTKIIYSVLYYIHVSVWTVQTCVTYSTYTYSHIITRNEIFTQILSEF